MSVIVDCTWIDCIQTGYGYLTSNDSLADELKTVIKPRAVNLSAMENLTTEMSSYAGFV